MRRHKFGAVATVGGDVTNRKGFTTRRMWATVSAETGHVYIGRVRDDVTWHSPYLLGPYRVEVREVPRERSGRKGKTQQ